MERIIIHSDLNNFYASVERSLNPSLRGLPVAVCGNKEERHGIVLAKSEEAKKKGVKTGEPIWQAKRKCPGLVTVPPQFGLYIEFSKKVRNIYARYTDFIESYGIDECWLDISKSTLLFPTYGGDKYIEENGVKYYSDGFLRHLGDTIRNAVREEVGVTVSCGVSFNKVYAKLGSDLKKPDGTSVISLAHYKQVVFGLPVGDLLYVGKSTAEKLKDMGIDTIGKLAAADDGVMYAKFGKTGATMLKNARGEDDSAVRHMDEKRDLKSIGNSCTYPEDVTDREKVRKLLYVLAESVATRLRESGQGLADTVHLWVRDDKLNDYTVQKKVRHTALCGEIAEHAYDLFVKNFYPPYKIRSLGVTVSGFDNNASQLTFDETCGNYAKRERAERAVDAIRKKYGYGKIQRGIVAQDSELANTDIRGTHLIKPAKIDYPDDSDGEKD